MPEAFSSDPADLETPAITPVAEPALELETPAIEGEEPEGEDEEDDLEFGFGKYRVPKSLKDGVVKLRAEFTQQAQTFAAERKALEERATARSTEQAKMADEEMNLRVGLHNVAQQLDHYSKWTAQQWAELEQNDPHQWTKTRLHVDALQRAQQELKGKISESDSKRTHEAQTAASKRIEQAEAYAATKGWKADKLEEVVKFAVDHGAKEHKMDQKAVGDLLHSTMSPLMLDFLELARVGKEALQSRTAAARKAKEEASAEPLEPLETVKAKTPPQSSRPSDNDSIEVWMKKREAQVRRKG